MSLLYFYKPIYHPHGGDHQPIPAPPLIKKKRRQVYEVTKEERQPSYAIEIAAAKLAAEIANQTRIMTLERLAQLSRELDALSLNLEAEEERANKRLIADTLKRIETNKKEATDLRMRADVDDLSHLAMVADMAILPDLLELLGMEGLIQ